ncbi:RNA polymerase sigma-70 factor [Pontibacter korlensis]|uniref:RNA polymerase sigma factor n=1 Tax=Pontibacter korlensis TaxID=400092 RepID=UPI000696B534|nr:RNA polymerase sigma-70 factor [Pontibacter korlensis]
MHSADKERIEHLVNSLLTGDEGAFACLYREFEARLYTFAFKLTQDKIDAEEVVQEVFLKVWEKRHTLNPQQSFGGFLFTVAKNIVYNKAKQRAYHFAFQKYLAYSEQDICRATENNLGYNELGTLLDKIYEALPPVRRKVFLMSRLQGLSNSEIAAELNTSTSNIENHLNKALRFIREKLQAHEIICTSLLAFLLS